LGDCNPPKPSPKGHSKSIARAAGRAPFHRSHENDLRRHWITIERIAQAQLAPSAHLHDPAVEPSSDPITLLVESSAMDVLLLLMGIIGLAWLWQMRRTQVALIQEMRASLRGVKKEFDDLRLMLQSGSPTAQ